MLRAEDKGLAQGYAESMFGLAQAEKLEDQLQEELFEFKKVLSASYELKDFLNDAHIAPQVKQAALKELVNQSASLLFQAMLDTMVVNGRAYLVEDVIDIYLETMKVKKKRVIAEVSTAVPLTDDLQIKVAKRLSDATGYTTVVSNTVEKTVLGGMVVRMEGKVLDTSTKKKLDDLKNLIGSAG